MWFLWKHLLRCPRPHLQWAVPPDPFYGIYNHGGGEPVKKSSSLLHQYVNLHLIPLPVFLSYVALLSLNIRFCRANFHLTRKSIVFFPVFPICFEALAIS